MIKVQSKHKMQRLFQITNLMHNSFIIQQYVCYTTILNMFRAARCSKHGIKELCNKLVIWKKVYTMMHGQKNIK